MVVLFWGQLVLGACLVLCSVVASVQRMRRTVGQRGCFVELLSGIALVALCFVLNTWPRYPVAAEGMAGWTASGLPLRFAHYDVAGVPFVSSFGAFPNLVFWFCLPAAVMHLRSRRSRKSADTSG